MFYVSMACQLTLVLISCQSVKTPVQNPLLSEIRCAKSGGVAGLNEQIDISREGEVYYKRKQVLTQFSLSKEELSTLRKLVLDIDTLNLKSEYKPEGKVFDDIKYRLTLGERTIVIHESAMPKTFEGLISFLNQLSIKSKK